MAVDPPGSPAQSQHAAAVAGQVIELLEVLWERGRDAVSSAPVSSSQLRVMYSLERDEGMNLRTLGEMLGATPSSVSRLCDRLQALGYVRRGSNPASRREVELRLTGHGSAYLHGLRARREEALHAAVSEMEPAAREALLYGLTGFRAAVGTGLRAPAEATGLPPQSEPAVWDTSRSA
ncbi:MULTISPECIES: MarR family transcriptional regulator [unclassified Streptomyces]|uniref:MarR family winged helix-turn-helix transcriptional regulator n=1 Tax=unclassified Streptomyces TaxID=2593676 RepID=UPI0033B8DCC7